MTRRVALVTGASRNIGRAIAQALAAGGDAVVCFGRDRAALEETAALIAAAGGEASVCVGDAANNDDLQAAVQHAVQRFGGLQVVVNNAGALRDAKAEALSPADFAADLQVNLVAQFALAHYAYPELKKQGGVIVNIGSVAGQVAFPRCPSYVTSKAGIEGLTRALAHDWARDNIRVVCVAPGYVESNISKDILADPAARDWITKRIPMRRVAKPHEIAAFVAFMASDAASFCTGEVYTVDGGQRMAI
ncbi:MAG: SDR family oxidoreductase [Burkholderiales bacterium]|nr:SDR family oxidoreductase [Burkholderiales bacterium]